MGNKILIPDDSTFRLDFRHNAIVIFNLFSDVRNRFKTSLEDIQAYESNKHIRLLRNNSVMQFNPKDLKTLKFYLSYVARELTNSDVKVEGLILHLDAHAHDGNGNPYLLLADNVTKVFMVDIAEHFAELYKSAKGCFTVCASTCYGISFLQMAAKTIEKHNAPFSNIIGPVTEICDEEADRFWTGFYTAIYSNENLVDTFAGSKFALITITQLMYNSFKSHLENLSTLDNSEPCSELAGQPSNA